MTAGTRSADWRFLLPAAPADRFEHLLLLGGSPELAQTVRDLGVAERVSATLRTGDPADAIVVLDGATDRIETVVQHLGEQGVLYWEIDRRRPSHVSLTPRRALRRLQRLGLAAGATYWVKPGFPARDMYLPLGNSAALKWYLDALYRPTTAARRAAKRILHSLVAWNARLDAFAPCYAITAGQGMPRPLPLVGRACAEQVVAGGNIEALMLAHGHTESNRIVMVLFGPGASAPRAVLKMPRTSEFNGHTEAEHHALAELADRIPPSIHDSIPRSTLFHWNRLAVSAQSCIGGVALDTRTALTATATLDDLRLVADWLADFHRATVVEHAVARAWLAERLERLAGQYANSFGLTGAVRHLFSNVSRNLAALGSERLPIAWQHRDLVHWNVYRDANRLGVIDWESARRGPVLADLLYFVTHWAASVTGCHTHADRRQLFERLFCHDAEDPLAASIHEQIREYMRRVQLSPSLRPFLLLYTFLEQALHPTPKFQTSATRTGRGDDLHAAFIDTMARHADRLFPVEVPVRPDQSRAMVTVAVATMNRPDELQRCVVAILHGRTLPAEIVIVDQSSNDRTADLVRASGWTAIVPVRYLRQPRRGLAACRNTAAAHATQPIIAFTDDDCVPEPGWVTALIEAFESDERPDAVTGCVLPLGPERPGLYPVSTRPSRTRAVYRKRSLPWAVGTGGNAAVQREWLERVHAFDERLGVGSPGQSAEDLDLFYRLLRAGAVIRYEPDAVIFHERQPVEGRLSRAASYGFGMGAVCALWARQRDAYTLWIVLRWCFDRGDTLLRACLGRQWWRMREELLTIQGACHGVAYGLTLANECSIPAASGAPFEETRVREAVR